MGYIRGKERDPKHLEALISERMKPGINANVPKIAGNTSTEHLIVLKCWMKSLKKGGRLGDRHISSVRYEGLIDILNTMYKRRRIS